MKDGEREAEWRKEERRAETEQKKRKNRKTRETKIESVKNGDRAKHGGEKTPKARRETKDAEGPC